MKEITGKINLKLFKLHKTNFVLFICTVLFVSNEEERKTISLIANVAIFSGDKIFMKEVKHAIRLTRL